MGRKSRRKKAGRTTTEHVSETRPSDPVSEPVRSYLPLWTSLHILLIILLSLLAYSNTFESPFHFDDEDFIVRNPAVRDLSYFTQSSPSGDLDIPFKKTFTRRYIGFLTFALNYRLHGLNVTGYHIVNLFVHICTSLLLYFFVILSFRTPFLRNSAIKDHTRGIALFTALLFACHPLQTQAVTYIWQRVTSLSTMFYLLSLVAYIKWRLDMQKSGEKIQGIAAKTNKILSLKSVYWYLGSVMCAILAMKTKEIAFMLPVMLVLYEMIFFEGKLRSRLLYLVPFLLTMLIIPLTLISIDKPVGELLGDIDDTVKGNTELSRGEYLFAEFRVLVTYLRLIFVPVNQNLDYDYSRYYSFFNIEVFSSFAFLALLFGLSIYLLSRYRDSVPHTRLISFGIIWFFINLLLESSIIPLNNVIFEHRMYLPSAGVFFALTTAIYMAIERRKAYAKIITAILAGTVIVLTGATYARNSVWKDELTLWQDVVNKSPHKARGHNNLGNRYREQGDIDRAIEIYRIAIKHDPNYPEAHNNLGIALMSTGLIEKAIEHYQISLRIDPEFAEAHNNLATAYTTEGLYEKAIEHAQISINLMPHYPEAHSNLAMVYIKQGRFDDALKEAGEAIRLDAEFAEAYNNLSTVYRKLGRHAEAITAAEQALRVRPGYAFPHNSLGLAFVETGQFDKAMRAFNNAVDLDHDYTEAYSNLGALYLTLGRYPEAIEAFHKAVEIDPDYINSRFNLAVAYFLLGERESSMEEYRVLKELSPEDAERLWSIIKRKGD